MLPDDALLNILFGGTSADPLRCRPDGALSRGDDDRLYGDVRSRS
jgi:hypothetical protein